MGQAACDQLDLGGEEDWQGRRRVGAGPVTVEVEAQRLLQETGEGRSVRQEWAAGISGWRPHAHPRPHLQSPEALR